MYIKNKCSVLIGAFLVLGMFSGLSIAGDSMSVDDSDKSTESAEIEIFESREKKLSKSALTSNNKSTGTKKRKKNSVKNKAIKKKKRSKNLHRRKTEPGKNLTKENSEKDEDKNDENKSSKNKNDNTHFYDLKEIQKQLNEHDKYLLLQWLKAYVVLHDLFPDYEELLLPYVGIHNQGLNFSFNLGEKRHNFTNNDIKNVFEPYCKLALINFMDANALLLKFVHPEKSHLSFAKKLSNTHTPKLEKNNSIIKFDNAVSKLLKKEDNSIKLEGQYLAGLDLEDAQNLIENHPKRWDKAVNKYIQKEGIPKKFFQITLTTAPVATATTTVNNNNSTNTNNQATTQPSGQNASTINTSAQLLNLPTPSETTTNVNNPINPSDASMQLQIADMQNQLNQLGAKVAELTQTLHNFLQTVPPVHFYTPPGNLLQQPPFYRVSPVPPPTVPATQQQIIVPFSARGSTPANY